MSVSLSIIYYIGQYNAAIQLSMIERLQENVVSDRNWMIAYLMYGWNINVNITCIITFIKFASKLHLTSSKLHLSSSKLHLTSSNLHLTSSNLHLSSSMLHQSSSKLHLTSSNMHLSCIYVNLTCI